MGVPPGRRSKARGRARRAQIMKLKTNNLIFCDNCAARKLAHRVCPSCGFYKGREVLAQDE